MNKKPNIAIFKEPKGLIKVIELGITIFAFATVAGFIGRFTFKVNCLVGRTMRPVEGVFYYPFNYLNVYAAQPCENETRDDLEKFTPQIDYRSEAEYFVFTGVTSMLFVLVAAGYYVFFEDRAKDATSTDVGLFSFPVVDFVFTIVLVIFWFTSSIAWAAGFSGLKEATSQENVFKGYPACTDQSNITLCEPNTFQGAVYGAPLIAVILGFLNFFVWGGNLWFLFKETPWHSPRSSGMKAGEIPQQEPPHQEIPPSAI